jgi:hypothetical protein
MLQASGNHATSFLMLCLQIAYVFADIPMAPIGPTPEKALAEEARRIHQKSRELKERMKAAAEETLELPRPSPGGRTSGSRQSTESSIMLATTPAELLVEAEKEADKRRAFMASARDAAAGL